MSNYQPHWDLTTVPTAEWNKENGRRQRAKGPAATNQVLRSCASCGKVKLNTTQSRKPCPVCGYVHPRVTR